MKKKYYQTMINLNDVVEDMAEMLESVWISMDKGNVFEDYEIMTLDLQEFPDVADAIMRRIGTNGEILTKSENGFEMKYDQNDDFYFKITYELNDGMIFVNLSTIF